MAKVKEKLEEIIAELETEFEGKKSELEAATSAANDAFNNQTVLQETVNGLKRSLEKLRGVIITIDE